MNTYKVIQWATGVVGAAAVKGIVRHPQLELVGCKVDTVWSRLHYARREFARLARRKQFFREERS